MKHLSLLFLALIVLLVACSTTPTGATTEVLPLHNPLLNTLPMDVSTTLDPRIPNKLAGPSGKVVVVPTSPVLSITR